MVKGLTVGSLVGIILPVLLNIEMLEGCNPVSGYEENFDIAVLAFIEAFDVPDSSSQQSIRVMLKGSIGETTAFSFDRINFARTDTLFRIGVWGRQVEKAGVKYEQGHLGFDTTLVLTSPRSGKHYVEVVAAQGVLRDSTIVY